MRGKVPGMNGRKKKEKKKFGGMREREREREGPGVSGESQNFQLRVVLLGRAHNF